MEHINNVAYARLFEEARIRFNLQMRGISSTRTFGEEVRMVVVANHLYFLQETFYPDPLQIGVGILEVGNASYTLGCGMFQAGRLVALNDTVVVHAHEGSSRPLPEATRAWIERYRIHGDSAVATPG